VARPSESPPRAFLDANVVFSAVLSSHGVPRELMPLGARGTIQVVVSRQVVEEIRRNLSEIYPEFLHDLLSLLTQAGIEVVADVSEHSVEEVIEYIPYPPDAAIFAPALEAGVDYFVTGDRKHFLTQPEIQDRAGIPILSPREFLERINEPG
jgi:predicted nucleic acid-binding protein